VRNKEQTAAKINKQTHTHKRGGDPKKLTQKSVVKAVILVFPKSIGTPRQTIAFNVRDRAFGVHQINEKLTEKFATN
jgi:hypothetical protein